MNMGTGDTPIQYETLLSNCSYSANCQLLGPTYYPYYLPVIFHVFATSLYNQADVLLVYIETCYTIT